MAALNPNRPYAKTDKGREEVAKRSHGLPQAMRSVLILIDGKAPMQDLLKRYESIPAFSQDVVLLLEQGYIAEVPKEAPTLGRAREASSDNAKPGNEKERLIELANRLFGNHAGPVIAKLEKGGASAEDLSASIESCYKLIKLTIDEQKAEQFREFGRKLLAAAH